MHHLARLPFSRTSHLKLQTQKTCEHRRGDYSFSRPTLITTDSAFQTFCVRLQIYIYDYFRKRNFHGAAAAILMETQQWQTRVDWPFQLSCLGDSPHSLLYEWWSAFWAHWTEYRTGMCQVHQASISSGSAEGGGTSASGARSLHEEDTSILWGSENPEHQLSENAPIASTLLPTVDARPAHGDDPNIYPAPTVRLGTPPPLTPINFVMQALGEEFLPSSLMSMPSSCAHQQSAGSDTFQDSFSESSMCVSSLPETPNTPLSSLISDTSLTPTLLEQPDYVGQLSSLQGASGFTAPLRPTDDCSLTLDPSQPLVPPLRRHTSPADATFAPSTRSQTPSGNTTLDMLNANFGSPFNIAKIERMWAAEDQQAYLQAANASSVPEMVSTVSSSAYFPSPRPPPSIRSHLPSLHSHDQLQQRQRDPSQSSTKSTETARSRTPESSASSSIQSASSQRQYNKELVSQCMQQIHLGEKDVSSLTYEEKAAIADRISRLRTLQANAQTRIASIHSGSPAASCSLKPS